MKLKDLQESLSQLRGTLLRNTFSKNEELDLSKRYKQPIHFKPKGLWYAIGGSWKRWSKREGYDGTTDNRFLIDIDESRILRMSNLKQLISFTKKYAASIPEIGESASMIDWDKVSKDYAGIEINPYVHAARLNMKTMWYYGWDVASGCIWDLSIIKNYKKINQKV